MSWAAINKPSIFTKTWFWTCCILINSLWLEEGSFAGPTVCLDGLEKTKLKIENKQTNELVISEVIKQTHDSTGFL